MTLSVDLTDRVALVTGASSGLGRHFARTLAGHGAAVAVAARRRPDLDTLVEEIRAEGGRAHTIVMDVTDAASIGAGFDLAERTLGTVQVLVNNSGVAIASAALDITEADWDRVLDTNLKGAFLVAREAARRMVAAGVAGSIINTASILGVRLAAGVASYAASKAGLRHLTGALALELAKHRIRVNALAPGYIETDINREFFQTEQGQAMIRRIPQRRLGLPQDLDGTLLLLASDASAYMTGSTVVVDGGHLMSSL